MKNITLADILDLIDRDRNQEIPIIICPTDERETDIHIDTSNPMLRHMGEVIVHSLDTGRFVKGEECIRIWVIGEEEE